MFLDGNLTLAANFALPTATGTTVVGSQIDTVVAEDQGNVEENIYLVITVGNTAMKVASTAGTFQFQLVSDTVAPPSTTAPAGSHLFTPKFSVSSTGIAAGVALFVAALPQNVVADTGSTYARFLGLLGISATNALTQGTVNAFLTNDPANWKAYKAAI